MLCAALCTAGPRAARVYGGTPSVGICPKAEHPVRLAEHSSEYSESTGRSQWQQCGSVAHLGRRRGTSAASSLRSTRCRRPRHATSPGDPWCPPPPTPPTPLHALPPPHARIIPPDRPDSASKSCTANTTRPLTSTHTHTQYHTHTHRHTHTHMARQPICVRSYAQDRVRVRVCIHVCVYVLIYVSM
jgi:hypothetical protein